MCSTRLAGNTRRKNDVKRSPSAHHRTNLSSYIFATNACIDNRKKKTKLVKQQYLLHTSLQYGKFRPTNGRHRFGSLGHPSKFQRVSRRGFVKPHLHDNRLYRVNKHPTGCQSGCETGLTTGFTTGLTTGCIVYTNIYPVVKPLSNRFDNRFDNRLYRVNGALL